MACSPPPVWRTAATAHWWSERLDKVGGRASTDDIDGFKVNNGAIVIEVGGITQQTCEEVGAPVRHP